MDLRALAWLRIGLAGLVLWDLCLRLPDLQAFHTDSGVLPRVLLLQLKHRTFFNLHFAAESVWGVGLLHLLTATAALCMFFGYHTRWSTLATWALCISLRHRNPWILDAGDLQLKVVLFWSIFLPLGARGSIDALRNPHWSGLPNVFSTPATAGLVLQMGAIYLFAALAKTDPVWWHSGDALYYAFHLDSFSTSAAEFARSYPSSLRPLTFATLGCEFAIPLLLWCPWRNRVFRSVGLALLVALHLGIGLFLHLGLMVPIALVCSVGLLPWAPSPASAKWVGVLASLHTRLPVWSCRFPDNVDLRELPHGYAPGAGTKTLLLFACAYVGLINVAVLKMYTVPLPIQAFGYATQLFQSWEMFAPEPGKDDGWFIVEGSCVNRRVVDLARDGQTVSWHKPENVSAMFRSQRWRCWYLNLRSHNDARVNQRFLRWASERWNAEHSGEERLYYVRLIYVAEPTPPPGKPFITQAQVLAELRCHSEEGHLKMSPSVTSSMPEYSVLPRFAGS